LCVSIHGIGKNIYIPSSVVTIGNYAFYNNINSSNEKSTPSNVIVLVTDEGIVILVNLPQPLNVSEPMLVTDEGIVILVNLPQPSNALLPILFTVSNNETTPLQLDSMLEDFVLDKTQISFAFT
jgi:hypothetical protein